MRRLFLISVLLLSLPSAVCFAQRQKINWDETLDRYELICERCIELLEQQRAGHRVPQESLSSIMVQLSMLKQSLEDAKGEMSRAQKARFEMIRQKFAGRSGAGRTAQVSASENNRERRANRSGFGRLKSGPGGIEVPEVTYDNREHLRRTSARSSYGVHSLRRPSVLAAIQASVYPAGSYGLLTGVSFRKFGAYAKFRHDFRFNAPSSEYVCDINGNLPGGGKIWASGGQIRRRMAATAGGIFRFNRTFSVYAGLGYGSYSSIIEDVSGRWAQVSDISGSGLALDAGAMIFLGRNLFLGAGVDVTRFRYTEIELTLGVSF